MNGDETVKDCGGGAPKCAPGLGCKIAGDCIFGTCTGGSCAESHHDDGVKNFAFPAMTKYGKTGVRCARD